MAVGEAGDKGLQLPPPLGPRQGAQVVAIDRKQVIDAHEGRIIGKHLLRDDLTPKPLLQRVEARSLTPLHLADRKSVVEGKRVSVPVEFGGRRTIQKKNDKKKKKQR